MSRYLGLKIGYDAKDYPGMTTFQRQQQGTFVSAPSGIIAPVKSRLGSFLTGLGIKNS